MAANTGNDKSYIEQTKEIAASAAQQTLNAAGAVTNKVAETVGWQSKDGPSATEKLGEAYQNVKESIGIAGDKAAAHADDAKQQTGVNADKAGAKLNQAGHDAAQATDNIRSDVGAKADAAGNKVQQKGHEAAQNLDQAGNAARSKVDELRSQAANKINPNTNTRL